MPKCKLICSDAINVSNISKLVGKHFHFSVLQNALSFQNIGPAVYFFGENFNKDWFDLALTVLMCISHFAGVYAGFI